ncbi:hypothetical protein HY405_01255 [Candidatus Microgenomates bacterium]|nr:hypothetical protein [Candidatus Microgenomates bacterium]
MEERTPMSDEEPQGNGAPEGVSLDMNGPETPSDIQVRGEYIQEKWADLNDDIDSFAKFALFKGSDKASIREWVEKTQRSQGQTIDEESVDQKIEEKQREVAQECFDARLEPDNIALRDVERVLNQGDNDKIRQYFHEQVVEHIRSPLLPTTIIDGEEKTFPEDQAWLDSWKTYFEQHPELGINTNTSEKLPEEGKLIVEQIQDSIKNTAQAFKDRFKRLPTKEDIARMARNAYDRIDSIRIFGQPLTDLATGTLAGAGVRMGVRMALSGAGGWIAPIAAGAAGGGFTAGFREYRQQRRQYQDYVNTLTSQLPGQEELSQENLQLRMAELIKLRDEMNYDQQRQEALSDQYRYLRFHLKQIEQKGRKEGKSVLSAFFESEEGQELIGNKTDQERILGEIGRTQREDWGKVGLAVGRGTIGGAVAGAVGAGIVELFHEESREAVGRFVQERAVPFGKTLKEAIVSGELIRPRPEELPDTFIAGGKELPYLPSVAEDTQSSVIGVEEAPAPTTRPEVSLSPDLAVMPEVVDLTQGSNPWNETAKYLEDYLGRPPTNAEILQVDQAVARASNIAVPNWGIEGQYLHTELPVGFDLHFDDSVKQVIASLESAPSAPLEATSAVLPTEDLPSNITSFPTETVPQPIEVSTFTPPSTPTEVALSNLNAFSDSVDVPIGTSYFDGMKIHLQALLGRPPQDYELRGVMELISRKTGRSMLDLQRIASSGETLPFDKDVKDLIAQFITGQGVKKAA